MARIGARGVGAAGLAAIACVTVSCAVKGPPIQRCRELEPQITPAAAWDDIRRLETILAEWVELDCRRVLAEAD